MTGAPAPEVRKPIQPAKGWCALLAGNRPVDPYLVAADLTGFRTLAPPKKQGNAARSDRREASKSPASHEYLPFLVETKEGAYKLAEEAGSMIGTGYVRIPSVYRRSLVDGGPRSRFVTCLVKADKVVEFLKLPQVVRAQLGLARIGSVDERTPADDDKDASIEFFESRSPYSRREYENREPLPAALHERPVIGVIDDGCPFLHPNLQRTDSGGVTGSRVARLWQQDESAVGLPLYLGYGRVITRSEMGKKPPASVLRQARRSLLAGHGTSVTHLVAGNDSVFPQERPSGTSAQDCAASADLIAVQFPWSFLKDTAGSALCVHALDAVRYIIDRAETYAPEGEGRNIKKWRVMRNVVINMSYGTLSGPHDGTALLDCALDELITKREGLRVVVAAGNGHRIPCHAHLKVTSGHPGLLSVFVAPDNPLLTSVEIWFPKIDEGANIELLLIDPLGRQASSSVVAGNFVEMPSRAGQNSFARLIFPKKTALGTEGSMALLIIDPTRGAGIRRNSTCGDPAPSGVWRLQVKNTGATPLTLDAWVERSDIADKRMRRQQAYFVGECVVSVAQRRSLASPASAAKVHSVGATRVVDGKVTGYSARDGAKPTHVNNGDYGYSLAGLRTPGALAGTVRRISGTSAAAPLHARSVVNDLCKGGKKE